MRRRLPLIYRLALLLYPRRFRNEYAHDLVETLLAVEHEIATRSALDRFAQRARELAAILRNAAALRRGHPDLPQLDRGLKMEILLADCRRAARGLLRTPGLTVSIVVTLALAIGVNTALFSVVNAVLLAPLPYPDADRLLWVWQELDNRGADYYPSAPADLVDYARAEDIEDIGGLWPFNQALVDDDGPAERVQSAGVTANFFDLIGVQPLLGRTFTSADEIPQPAGEAGEGAFASGTVMISFELWQRRYGGDPGILGRTLDLSGDNRPEVVGVLPANFRLLLPAAAEVPEHVDTFHPMRVDWSDPARDGWFLRTVARLTPDGAVAAAQAQLNAINDWQWKEFPIYANAGTQTYVAPLHDALTAPSRGGLLALFGAVGFVLLIACVNVVNLLLVRATLRAREVAVRAALGAGRLRLVREVLLEAGFLAVAGAAAGVALAAIGVRALQLLGPAEMPRLNEAGVDLGVLLFASATCAAVALGCGLAVALRAGQPRILETLRGREAVGPGQDGLRRVLVVVEVALSLILLVGATLTTRGLGELLAVDLGFEPRGVLVFEAGLRGATGDESPTMLRDTLRERIAALPGAEAVATISAVPLGDGSMSAPYGNAAEMDDGEESDFRQANVRVVSSGYFAALQTPMRAGRDLGTDDEQTAAEQSFEFPRERPMSVIIDQATADRSWPQADPLGELLYMKLFGGVWLRVVGVVDTQRTLALAGEERGTVYMPDWGTGTMQVVVRVDGDPAAMASPVRAALLDIDARIVMADVRPLSGYVGDALAPARFASSLMALFALLAVVLAAVGLYGVMASTVRSRSGEIGLRMALGASHRSIWRRVVGQGLVLVLVGIVIGEIVAIGLARLIVGMLYGISPLDPMTYVTVPLVIAAMATLACWLPARRATRIDPLEALRSS